MEIKRELTEKSHAWGVKTKKDMRDRGVISALRESIKLFVSVLNVIIIQ